MITDFKDAVVNRPSIGAGSHDDKRNTLKSKSVLGIIAGVLCGTVVQPVIAEPTGAFSMEQSATPSARQATRSTTGSSEIAGMFTVSTFPDAAGSTTTNCAVQDCAAVSGKSNSIGVLGVHTTTTGTGAGVKGETLSSEAGATGVLGELDASVTAPGAKAAGVKGLVHAGNLGIGVFGMHEGGGKGVQGESATGVGVYAKGGGTSHEKAALVVENTLDGAVGGNAIYAKSNGGSPTIVAENKGAGNLFVGYDRNDQSVFTVFNDGKVKASVIEITGGSDLAERFSVSDKAEPGTLMVIDEHGAGQLTISKSAYDSRVAGIVSGAGGVNPGMTLRQDQVLDGDAIISIAGRVYVKAEALTHPIKPGDLLTTSSLPGHAMKAAERARAQGAVIGKAMTELDRDTGLVLVLVNLQ